MGAASDWKAALEYEEKVLDKVLDTIVDKVKKDKPSALAKHFVSDWVQALHHGSKHPGRIKNLKPAQIADLVRAENQVLAILMAALPENTSAPVEKWRNAFTVTMNSNNFVLKYIGYGQPDPEGLEARLRKLK